MRGDDAGVQRAGGAGDGAGGAVGGGAADACGGGEVEHVEVAVEGLGGLWAGDFGGAVGVGEEGEGDDVSVGKSGGAGGDVVGEEAGLAAVRLLGAAVLVEGGLQEGIEGGAVVGDGEAFEALVVVAAGLGVGGMTLREGS